MPRAPSPYLPGRPRGLPPFCTWCPHLTPAVASALGVADHSARQGRLQNASARPPGPAGVAVRPESIDTAATLQVLVVDESQAQRIRVRSALEQAGLTVVGEAEDGAQALTQAAAHHPDVVLMDLRMPRMDGVQATRILRRQQPDTPVVCGLGMTTPSSIGPSARPRPVKWCRRRPPHASLRPAMRSRRVVAWVPPWCRC
jgi:hypothetical protein